MAFFSVPGISILGMAAAVPAHCEHNHALALLTEQEDNHMLVKKMKEVVPEFISQNSLYENLDYRRTEEKTATTAEQILNN